MISLVSNHFCRNNPAGDLFGAQGLEDGYLVHVELWLLNKLLELSGDDLNQGFHEMNDGFSASLSDQPVLHGCIDEERLPELPT